MEFDKEEFTEIIEKFKDTGISIKEQNRTLLQLARVGHREIVCSNLLAYFFDSKENHGFGSLFFNTFLDCLGENPQNEERTSVSKEVSTSKGNKIDIVIETENYLVAIENKMYAGLYNDLEDYSDYVDSVSKGRKTIKVVLSLKPLNDTKLSESKFVNIVHSNFLKKIKDNSLEYRNLDNLKNWIYLDEFLKTMNSQSTGGIVMDKEYLAFYEKNTASINKLVSVHENARKTMESRVNHVKDLITIEEKCRKYIIREWIYKDYPDTPKLVYDFALPENIKIAVDIVFYLKGGGISIEIFGRRGTSSEKVLELLKKTKLYKEKGEFFPPENSGIYQEDTKLNIRNSDEEIAKYVENILNQLDFPI